HTRSKRDWSSDVCSSDLGCGRSYDEATYEPSMLLDYVVSSILEAVASSLHGHYGFGVDLVNFSGGAGYYSIGERDAISEAHANRSEERRVGKETRAGWAA